MGCCGDKIKKLGTIAKSHAQVLYDKVFRVSGVKYEWADDRIRACHKCDKQTWMTRMEYLAWLAEHAKEVVQNIADLSVLTELPQMDNRSKTKLFCQICKCWIPGKARVKDEHCPMGLW